MSHLHPIAQVKTEDGKREGIVFIDSASYKTIYLRLSEIKSRIEQAGDLVGITDKVKLYQYYANIGTLGDNGKDSFTVIKRLMSSDKTDYLLSDTEGKLKISSRDGLVDMIKSGVSVAGAKMIKDKLCISQSTDLEIIKSQEKSNEA